MWSKSIYPLIQQILSTYHMQGILDAEITVILVNKRKDL